MEKTEHDVSHCFGLYTRENYVSLPNSLSKKEQVVVVLCKDS